MRVSLYLYNTKEEIDKFFEVLDKIIKKHLVATGITIP